MVATHVMHTLCAARRHSSSVCAVQIMSSATSEEVNFILLNINCAAFVEVCGPSTLDMLTEPEQRLPELTVLARSVSSTNMNACCSMSTTHANLHLGHAHGAQQSPDLQCWPGPSTLIGRGPSLLDGCQSSRKCAALLGTAMSPCLLALLPEEASTVRLPMQQSCFTPAGTQQSRPDPDALPPSHA